MKSFQIKKKISLMVAVMMLCLAVLSTVGTVQVQAGEALPDYTNSTPEAAANDIQDRLGKAVTYTEEATEDINKNGLVLRTNPPAGTDVDTIESVELVIGKYNTPPEPPTDPEPQTDPPTDPPETAPPTLTVPNVINMTQQAVQQSLTENGFTYAITTEDTNNAALNGLVIRTDPAIGTSGLPIGTTVTVFLGHYVPRRVIVPDVMNKSVAEATALANGSGLTVTVIETETDMESLHDKVFRQEPEAGTEMDEGSTVILHVYKYNEPETVPTEPDIPVTNNTDVIDVDGYKVYKKLKGISAPKNFVAANDPSTFEEPVEAFYSTVYGTFLYYAENNGEGGYYMYDRGRDTMFSYVSLSDAEGNSFVAAAPADKSEISDELIGQTEVNLGTLSNPLRVPAWLVNCPDESDATVLYLLKSNGTSGYYVYDNAEGITLTPWEEYKKEHNAQSDNNENGDKNVEPVSTEEETPEKDKGGFFRKNLIWIVIIAAILLLLIIAVFVVYKMSRRQEAMEIDEERRERRSAQEKNRTYRKQYDSSYTNDHTEDLEPFDISFENAFPDELGLNNSRRRPRERSNESFVDTNGALNESAFEELDRSITDEEDPYAYRQEPRNRDYVEPSDFGTGHARPKRTPKSALDDPIIPEEVDVDDPAPETIYTKKAKSKSGYQELLEDDFEVVDFSKKK